MKTRTVSDLEYLTHLRQQLDFLKSDVKQYIARKSHFALKLAVTLRTIFHNSKHSKALLPSLSDKYGIKIIFSNLGVKSTFDFYKILPKVKRRLDPQLSIDMLDSDT